LGSTKEVIIAKILYLSLERKIDLEKKHEVMYGDYTMMSEAFYRKVLEFQPDFLIEREFNDGKSKYPDLVKYVREMIPQCRRIIWLIDSHVQSAWHIEYALLFDYAFCAISSFVPVLAGKMREVGAKTKCFWLPLCYPQSIDRIKRNKSKVPFDIVFVGRWGDKYFIKRNRRIKLLQKRYKSKFFAITDYLNMEDYLRQGVISFNSSFSYDLNFRVFETIANGIELVTNDVPDLHLVKDLVDRINIYHNDEEMFNMIDLILSGKLEHDVIKSQIWVQMHHSLIHRHKAILKMVANNKQEEF